MIKSFNISWDYTLRHLFYNPILLLIKQMNMNLTIVKEVMHMIRFRGKIAPAGNQILTYLLYGCQYYTNRYMDRDYSGHILEIRKPKTSNLRNRFLATFR